MSYLLRLGDELLVVYACTPDVKVLVHRLGDLLYPFTTHVDYLCKDVSYLAVVGPTLSNETIYREPWLGGKLFVWDESRTLTVLHQPERFCLSSLPSRWWPQARFKNNNVEQITSSCEERKSNHFSVLLAKEMDEHSHIQVASYALLLANWHHIKCGGLLLHSAAVVEGHRGFLFLGQSEAGKTTIAKLSAELGHSPLGDDLNFVIRDGEKGYLMAAAPNVTASSLGCTTLQHPSLQGIFSLVQDSHDYLSPLSPQQMAKSLFDSFVQTPKTRHLPEGLVGLAFQTCCDIARRIPSYELHFRRSPDFWKLIDEQFPG